MERARPRFCCAATAVALRSASEFPSRPSAEALPVTYAECRSALISANRSRGALKTIADQRGLVILELRRELLEVQADLSDERLTKERLHAINSRLGGVLRDMEDTGDAMVDLIERSEQESGFWLVRMFQELVALARHWRQAKDRAAVMGQPIPPVGSASSGVGDGEP